MRAQADVFHTLQVLYDKLPAEMLIYKKQVSAFSVKIKDSQ